MDKIPAIVKNIPEGARKSGAKILLFLTTIIWGSSFFILKDTLDEVPVYFLLSFRFFFSSLILGLVCFKKWKLFNRQYLFKGVLTGVFLAFAYIFQTVGLQYTTPGTNAFLTTVYCVLVPFMGWAVTRKRPSVLHFAAAAVCLVGIGLVCLDGSGLGFTFRGEGFTLICGVFFALQIVAVERFGGKLDTMLFTTVQFFTAFVICFVFFLAKESFPTSLSTDSVLSLVYVTVMATCVAFALMNVGIKYASAVASSLILSLEGVFGVAFSMLFYHERLTLQVGMGFAVIFVALMMSEVLPQVVVAYGKRAFPSVRPRSRKEVYVRTPSAAREAADGRQSG